MKKYNYLILFSLFLYVLVSFLSSFLILQLNQNKSKEYRVEINRVMQCLVDENELEKCYKKDYQFIEKISLLKKNQTQEEVSNFFLESNDHESTIYPWYYEKEFKGYLKFTYQNTQVNLMKIVIIVEFGFFIMEVIILIILCYIKYQIIRPFSRISTLPSELAKGHFRGEIKIEKSKYFKNFLWGIGTLKDELSTSKKRELEFMKEKKQLLLSLSHDMKTPLNIIKLYMKSLDEEMDEEKRIDVFYQIGEKVKEMEHYIEEITKSSREEIFDLSVEIEEFYLSDLLFKVQSVYEEQCALRNIQLIIHPYQDCLIKGDCNRSQEVLENILENAIKYGDGKQIEIYFSEEEYHHLIYISNTGIAISENEINHLFDSFFRGKNAKGKTGSGLGLYICRELMTKMGGTIYAEIINEKMIFVLVFGE